MKKVLLKTLKKYKLTTFLTVFFIMLNIYFLTYPPKIIGKIVDLLYNIEGNREQIITYTFYLLGICIVLLLVRMPWRWLVGYVPRSIERDIKDKLFEQFMKIKMTSIQNIKNGELMSYFVKDIAEIRSFTYKALSHGTRFVFTMIIATYTMMSGVNIVLTLITLFPIIITTLIIIKIKMYLEQSYRKSQRYFTELSEFVQESTDAIRTTKAYTGETNQLKEFIRKNRKLREANNAVDVHSTLLSTCLNIGFGLCYGISLLYGSKLVLEGNISIGDFVAFNGYIGLFVGPVSWLPAVISRYKRAELSYKRLDKVFNLEREKISVKGNLQNEEGIKGNIEIKDLTFNYPEHIETVLNNINITVNKGETLGIIGTIGSGKTTLMNLLLRLYPVKNGKIFIDGQDINDIPLKTLRDNICYITQDNFLFSTTLRENVKLFKDGFEDEEIKESTKNAMIYDDIEKMQNGIDTIIGERGGDLSGGQKQRVVISRAFLNKSNIVIFDDTFSALDNRTEQKVLNNVKELVKDKTCIIISNRISDIKAANKIIVLDAGNIVEAGTHKTLIEEKGKYYEFYKQQSVRSEMALN
ncbi:MAG: ABC transporter ATP-binding protein [Clostridia bacterium]|nr:ABC transporter ATP-binding protein [Clostridia bacterium]